ncbi:hypothetical protein, partial [Bradymonas sediminis]|uniref:hypothetical protein n=1 Tax=Bradymonas sediminis TaxID=1548548 RepID=UPI001AACA1B3
WQVRQTRIATIVLMARPRWSGSGIVSSPNQEPTFKVWQVRQTRVATIVLHARPRWSGERDACNSQKLPNLKQGNRTIIAV